MKKLPSIFKKPMVWITIAGISLIPALYNISFLTSMWDPYGNLENLPVAVVNQDQSASLNGKTLTIGDDMVSNMEENPSLDYHFVDEETAEKGLAAGSYYMIITIPKDVSEKAASLLTDHPEKVTISYETSKGHSFVAAKMSDSAMEKLQTSVSKTITETYTTAVFQSMSSLQTGMETASAGSSKLENGAQQLADGSTTLTNGLQTLSASTGTLASGAGSLDAGIQSYTAGTAQLSSGLSTLTTGVATYTNGVATLASGSQQVADKSAALVQGVEQIQTGASSIQPLVDGASSLQAGLQALANATDLSEDKTQQLQTLVAGLPQLQAAINQLAASLSSDTTASATGNISQYLTEIASQAQAILAAAQADKASSLSALQATTTYQSLTAEQQAELSNAISSAPSTTADKAQAILNQVSAMSQALTSLQATSQALQAGVSQINASANQALPAATQTLTTLSTGLAQVHSSVNDQLLPGSQQIASNLSLFQEKLASGSETLLAGVSSYTAAVDKINAGAQTLAQSNNTLTSGVTRLSDGAQTLTANSDALTSGASQLASGSSQLASGANQLEAGSQTLTSGLSTVTTGLDSLAASLEKVSQQLALVSVSDDNAKSVSSPVSVKHTDKDKVATNGVGMAPYMMSVALMVVALSTNVIFAKSLDGKDFDNRWAWAKSKLLLNGLIATASAVILYGVVHLIGVQFAHPMATLGITILASWTFMALVTALIGWHSRYGSFLSLILLLLQLGASAGTYPIELSPRFFGVIQPYLPMTHTVAALRQTISMTGAVQEQVALLFAFLIGFMALGIVIFRRESGDEK